MQNPSECPKREPLLSASSADVRPLPFLLFTYRNHETSCLSEASLRRKHRAAQTSRKGARECGRLRKRSPHLTHSLLLCLQFDREEGYDGPLKWNTEDPETMRIIRSFREVRTLEIFLVEKSSQAVLARDVDVALQVVAELAPSGTVRECGLPREWALSSFHTLSLARLLSGAAAEAHRYAVHGQRDSRADESERGNSRWKGTIIVGSAPLLQSRLGPWVLM